MRKFDRMKPILGMRRKGATYAAIGAEFGVSTTTIHMVLARLVRQGNRPEMRDLWPAGSWHPFNTKNLPPDEVVDRWEAKSNEQT